MYCIMYMYILCCETNPLRKYERCGITIKVIFKVRKSNLDLSDVFELTSEKRYML